jgi:hypothetical protein
VKEIDINKSIKQLHMSAVRFVLSLHNKNNFCRSDVLNIIDNIEDKIIKPINLENNRSMSVALANNMQIPLLELSTPK